MEVMLILIPVTVALVGVALWSFVWSVKNEQFDDLDKEAYSILFDDPVVESKVESKVESQSNAGAGSDSNAINTRQPTANRKNFSNPEVTP
jgi:cbb3-type cytochrome oxidase maturation protein